MKKVLITGAYGFLGRNSALKFSREGYRVYGCGHGHWQQKEQQQWGIDHWLEGDISLSLLQAFAIEPDVIVHCAGSGSVGLSLENPALDFKKTVSGTQEVLEFIRTCSASSKLVYPSSAAVYGEHIDSPICTHEPLNPASPYGVHKKIAEELCTSYHNYFAVDSVIIRFFSIYGQGLQKQLLWDASHKLLADKECIEFWGTGNETRDWLYISDAAELIYLSSLSGRRFSIINGAFGEKTSIRETLSVLAAQLGQADKKICFNNVVRKGDPRFYHADMSDVAQYHWSAKISLQQGLQKYADWFKEISQ